MDRTTVDTSLTQADAQTKIVDYLSQTLAGLPPTVSLAKDAPTPTLASLSPAITVPCNDNDATDTGPVNLQDAFWVQGMKDGDQATTLDAVTAVFTTQGWSPERGDTASQQIVRAITPDGYALIANLNSVGGLSLSSSSPCFPKANESTAAVPTSVIPHPA